MELTVNVKTFVILGKTGWGKSSILNSLIGIPNYFPEGEGLKSQTKDIKKYKGHLNYNKNEEYFIIDTPGFYDSENEDKKHMKSIVEFLKTLKESGGLNLIFFVISLKEQKFDHSLQTCLSLLRTLLGENIFSRVKIIFTFKNDLNPKSLKKALDRFKELPNLLIATGFPVDHDMDTLIYDQDDPDEFGCKLVEVLKNYDKFYPQVLDDLENVDFDLDDPIKIFNALVNNSKSMKDLNNQLNNLKEITTLYKTQIESFEIERKKFNDEIKERQDKINTLLIEQKKETAENQKKISSMIQNYTSQINDMNNNNTKALEDMRRRNEADSQRILADNERYRLEHEKVRMENDKIIREEQEKRFQMHQKEIENLKAENQLLLNRPTVIHNHYDSDDDCVCLIF